MPSGHVSGWLSRLRPAPTTIFFAATWALLGVAGASRMFRDPGTFWHLLTGERILRNGLPHEDWLTFTFQGKPWIAHQWLSEAAMALVYRLGGYDALLIVASATLASLFAWLFQRFLERGLQVRWAVLITALGLMTSAGSIHLRPLLVSMVFFGWTYALLLDVESGRKGPRQLGWLIPLFVVWVNCHGAVLGGLATFWLASAWWLLAWLLGRASPVRDRREAVLLVLLLVGAALTPFVNPYGLEMVRTWLSIVRSPVVAETIVEHGSVWRTGSWFVLPLIAAYGLVFLGAGDARWRATALLPLVWLVLMLQRVRHAPLFAIVACLALTELLPVSRAVAWLARRGVQVCGRGGPVVRMTSLVWLVPALLLGFSAIRSYQGGKAFAGPDHSRWPFALKDDIEASARVTGRGAPILNDMAYGGFLSLEVPGIRVFGDDRCELYGDDFLRSWFEGSGTFFAEWISRFDVKLALAERGSRLDQYLRSTPGWRELDRDANAILYERAPVGE